MKHTEFFKTLKNGEIQNVYFFTGEEQYVMKSALKQLQSLVVDEDYKDVNLTVLPSNATGSKICASCETFPFFSEKRMVILEESVFLSKGEGKSEGEEQFLEYLKKPAETTVLVVLSRTPDKRRKIYKALSEHTLVEFDTLTESELLKWIEKVLRGYGLSVEPQALQFLIEYADPRPEALISELEKLSSYKGDGVVNKQDILSIITPCADYNVFKMTDAVLSKDTKTALMLLSGMLSQREEPILILGAVSKQLRQLFRVKTLLEEKKSRQEIISILGLRDFVYKKFEGFSKKTSVQGLKKAVDLCYKTDEGLKTGLLFGETALHALILQLTQI